MKLKNKILLICTFIVILIFFSPIGVAIYYNNISYLFLISVTFIPCNYGLKGLNKLYDKLNK